MTSDPTNLPSYRHIPNPTDLGAALAMLDTGFTEADVISVLGYMPNLEIDAYELEDREIAPPAKRATST